MNKRVNSSFLWGGAVSNVQAEGSNQAGGKGLNVYDELMVVPEHGQKIQGDTNVASNHYQQFYEDIDLIGDLGFKAYRISLVWSRIHPKGNESAPNKEGLAFYDAMIDALIARGIEPIVSLVHFDMPSYLAKNYNGFLSDEVVDFYTRHVTSVVKHFKNKVKYWITYNEINTAPFIEHSYLVAGAVKPEEMTKVEFFHKLTYNTQLASARAVNIIKNYIPESEVSGMITVNEIKAKDTEPINHLAARKLNEFNFYLFGDLICKGKYPYFYKKFLTENNIDYKKDDLSELIEAAPKITYLSISCYQTRVVTANSRLETIEDLNELFFETETQTATDLPASHWGWTVDPIGFRQELNDMYDRYHLPLFIVENGIGLQEGESLDETLNDIERIQYHKQYIKNMLAAINIDGVDIMGYLLWSPIDILSSHKEMGKRYGLIYIDELKDGKMKRIPKKSFSWYKDIISSLGEKVYE